MSIQPTNESSPLSTLLSNAGAIQKHSDEEWAAIAAASYLPRLQLMTAMSDKCKKGEFPINHYAFVNGQDYKDIGAEVDCLPFIWRPKALDVSDPNVPVSIFDVNSEEFKSIHSRSGAPNSGCMCGPEFLLWIPSVKAFATFFMGSKSAVRESANVKNHLNEPVTLKSRYIETAKYNWFAPAVTICTTLFELPTPEQLTEVVEKFNNPPEKVIEKVEEDTRER